MPQLKEKILYQGAEAVISLKDNTIAKHRIKKSYRIEEIDEKLIKQRTKSEAKIVEKLKEIINVPKIIKVNENKREIIMSFIQGKKLSDWLDNLNNKKAEQVCEIIGMEIAKIHDANIIHGDLTTSNMISKNEKVFFIDFGLSFHSKRIEDKAVDLHLLKQALEAKHFLKWQEHFKNIIKGYKENKDFEKIIEQLKKVEKRGRYKS